jgi:zinc protease
VAERDPLLVARETLDSGLQLVRQDAPAGSPSVSFTYVGPAGTAFDPKGLEGTALLASELMTLAAGRRDRRALARHLDGLGATLSADPSPECNEVTVWGPSDRWEGLLDILADAVLRPRFDVADLTKARRQLLERQLREERQPDSRADLEFLRAVFPQGHPYCRSGLGSRRSVGRIRRDGLLRFHRDHAVGTGAYVVATSSLSQERLAGAVQGRFSEWPAPRPPPSPELPAVGRPKTPDRIVSMPGRAQVELRIGVASLRRTDPLFPAAFLTNEVLGGRPPLSRLFQKVREKHGLAYHASSDLEAMSWGGFWQAQAGTGPERAGAVESLLKGEFYSLVERPIPSAELERIRTSSIGALQLDLETTQGIHDLAVDAAYYQLPATFYRDWPAMLRALKPSDLTEAAATYLLPANLVTVRAGP